MNDDYKRGYADAMNWKVQNHIEHLPPKAQPAQQEPVGTYGEIFESMRSLLRSGRQVDQQVYMAMRDKLLYTAPQPAQQEPLIPFRHGCKWCGKTDGCEHQQPAQQSCYCSNCESLSKQVTALKTCLEVERGFHAQEQPAQRKPPTASRRKNET